VLILSEAGAFVQIIAGVKGENSPGVRPGSAGIPWTAVKEKPAIPVFVISSESKARVDCRLFIILDFFPELIVIRFYRIFKLIPLRGL
jgi:hypothetical protein